MNGPESLDYQSQEWFRQRGDNDVIDGFIGLTVIESTDWRQNKIWPQRNGM